MSSVYVSNNGEVILHTVNSKDRVIGLYDKRNKIFRAIKTSKHILKLTESFGFNLEFINSYPLEEIQVVFKGSLYAVTKEVLLEKGDIAQYKNLEPQIFLPISLFVITMKINKTCS